MKIGQNIKAYRLIKGITQVDLAISMNVTRQAVSKWERDEAMPDTENLVQLSKALGVSVDALLNRNQEAKEQDGIVLLNKRKIDVKY
jgi:transcriptional regulator with XRE-family HTH domain